MALDFIGFSVGNLLECRELGTLKTTSSAEPVQSWQVLGESLVREPVRGAARIGADRAGGSDEEIDLLLRRWVRAKAGEGQIVLVSGEPGIGKCASSRRGKNGSAASRISAGAILFSLSPGQRAVPVCRAARARGRVRP